MESNKDTVKLTLTADLRLASLAVKAAVQWNAVMKDLVELIPSQEGNANILITFGKVNRSKHKNRIAQCQRLKEDNWLITLADDVTWAISWWSRFIGKGSNALAALLHELGHVYSLPHSDDPTFIMYPDIPNVNSISRVERKLYRAKFEADN